MGRRSSTGATHAPARRPRRSLLILGPLVLGACSQFSTDGLQLRTDESITITSPIDGSRLDAPIEVRWTDDAPRVGGRYVVLVDRSPMPPGEPVRWFARDDDTCVESQGCPDELWLARRGVLVTDGPSALVEIVPAARDGREGLPHELTIVRLDERGERDGESAVTVRFRLEDDG